MYKYYQKILIFLLILLFSFNTLSFANSNDKILDDIKSDYWKEYNYYVYFNSDNINYIYYFNDVSIFKVEDPLINEDVIKLNFNSCGVAHYYYSNFYKTYILNKTKKTNNLSISMTKNDLSKMVSSNSNLYTQCNFFFESENNSDNNFGEDISDNQNENNTENNNNNISFTTFLNNLKENLSLFNRKLKENINSFKTSINSFSDKIIDSIKRIFIPSDNFFDNFFNDFKSEFNRILNFHSIQNIFNSLLLQNSTTNEFNFNINLPNSFGGGNYQLFDYNIFNEFKELFHFYLSLFLWFIFIFNLYKKIPTIISGGD